MNDYVKGAFEALNWVEALLADIEPEKDPRDQLKKVVKEVVVVVRKSTKRHHNCSHKKREPDPPSR